MSALKNFAITFLISSVIFGVVAYFIVGFLTSTVSGILDEENDRLDQLLTEVVTEKSEENTDPPPIIPHVEGDSFTVLFCITDKRDGVFDYFPMNEEESKKIETGDKESFGVLTKDYKNIKVKSIILLRVSKETGEYSFISIPSNVELYTKIGKSGHTLLEDSLYYFGQEYFTKKVAAITGITPDYTLFANVTELDDILGLTGGFTCYIPDDIYSDGENYFTMTEEEFKEYKEKKEEEEKKKEEAENASDDDKDEDKDKTEDAKPDEGTSEEEEKEIIIEKIVSSGNVTVGATNIEAIFLCEDYSGGISGRSEILTGLLKGFISKLSGMDDEQLVKVYSELTKKGKIITDMEESQLMSKADLIRAYGEFTSTVFEYPGVLSGGVFDPDISAAVKQYLGLRLPPDPINQTPDQVN